ncbi:MAG: translational GTPase TypA, partial [Rhodospirillaceae bacterium]|nr:translational GTPase TypA [Rhodospirillaceae bacterium]
PMPQTKFVVGKALRLGLRPIVLINKVDKPEERAHAVHDEVFDLFAALDADDAQLDFPTLFASAKQGWAAAAPEGPHKDMAPLFDLILKHVPPPRGIEPDAPLRMLATTLEANPYLGRILTGRITAGTVRPNMTVRALGRDGRVVETGRISKLLAFRGLERQPIEQGEAGDIVAIAGLSAATVADTICDPAVSEPIPAQPIDPPTLAMTFQVNDSPLAGTEGDKVTSRVIRARLEREAEGNVALKISEGETKDAFEVAGRGELQLGILIETMRREGFELCIGRPQVVYRTDPDTGQRLEPVEEVTIDVDEDYSGAVVDKLAQRRAELVEMRPSGGGKQRLVFFAPTRGLIGYHNEFMTDTRGTGVMNRVFHAYQPHRGTMPSRRTGVLISNDEGEAVAYALWNLEDRGPMMIDPGDKVYRGMIVGEHSRGTDLEVNVLKGKKLTNIRAAGKDDNVLLTPPLRMTLERALTYINDDELVEVTPKTIRLRKRQLDPHERKRESRKAEAV